VKGFPRLVLDSELAASIRLVTMPSAPFWARRHARDVLGKWRMPAETTETAELLVSELVTNACKFSGPPSAIVTYSGLGSAGIIDVTLRYLPGRLVIEVSDSDPSPPVAANPGLDSESGRGLMLVDALTEEWSYFLPPSGGKTVYCVIRVTEDNHMNGTASERELAMTMVTPEPIQDEQEHGKVV
jgi:anti-sigma regulatory factor (Ser/Thr protein kinase)